MDKTFNYENPMISIYKVKNGYFICYKQAASGIAEWDECYIADNVQNLNEIIINILESEGK